MAREAQHREEKVEEEDWMETARMQIEDELDIEMPQSQPENLVTDIPPIDLDQATEEEEKDMRANMQRAGMSPDPDPDPSKRRNRR